MPNWEYKVITSGKGGFATPALLEKFLNDLGRDEWEIVHFQSLPENFLAFTGLARRSTQRDWTLEDAAAAAAKAEAEKLRAEFEAKFKAASSAGPGAVEERAPSFLEEKVGADDGFRKPVDTSHDAEPEDEEEAKADEWDKLTAAEDDELPTFFEAMRPHMRRNQRGPGMSVGVDYLAKKWDQLEDDIRGALVECGFVVPEDEDTKPEYLEYDGDLYWLNVNRRGELWINTREKPRPVFRTVKAQKAVMEDEAAAPAAEDKGPKAADEGQKSDAESPKAETASAPEGKRAKAESSGGPLPQGPALLEKIRPHMRRNRHAPGGSGSSTFLARALRIKEADLKEAFVGLGLTMPAGSGDKPVFTEFGKELWWLNLDSRGGLWINGREKREGETASGATEKAAAEAPAESASGTSTPGPEVASAPSSGGEGAAPAPEVPLTEATPASSPAADNPTLAAVRLLLKETRTGTMSGKIDRLAEEMGKTADDFVASLVAAGLKVPEKPREKAVYVVHAGENFWLNKNAKGELWVNAKAAKTAGNDDEGSDEEGESDSAGGDGDSARRSGRRGGRSRAKKAE